MANAEADDGITVELAYSPSAGVVEREPLRLPAGACVADALRHGAMAQRHAAVQAALEVGGPAVGIWGKRCSVEQPLRDGDRVEVYRPLLIDPKDARRERQRRQQMRSANAAGDNGRRRGAARLVDPLPTDSPTR